MAAKGVPQNAPRLEPKLLAQRIGVSGYGPPGGIGSGGATMPGCAFGSFKYTYEYEPSTSVNRPGCQRIEGCTGAGGTGPIR